jgi:hypothetical protein
VVGVEGGVVGLVPLQPVFVVTVLVVMTDPAIPNPAITMGGVNESCQMPPPKENCIPRLATLYPTFTDRVVNGPASCCTEAAFVKLIFAPPPT